MTRRLRVLVLLAAVAATCLTAGCSRGPFLFHGKPQPPPFPALRGLQETRSGLRYLDIVEGNGPTPSFMQSVTMEYTCWSLEGVLLESTITRGEPLTFLLGGDQILPGVEEGVRRMHAGGHAIIVVPPPLGYDPKKVVPPVPDNTTLVFDVTVLKIEQTPQDELDEPF